MARYNKCANPALGANANDWAGTGGTGSGRVSVSGFDRPWGIRRTGQTTTMWVAPPYNAAASGETWTDSLYAKSSVSQEVRVYVRAYDSVGTKVGETTVAYVTLAAGVVTRLSGTFTMPALTAFQRIEVYYEAAAAADTIDFTMALSELVSTLGSYFDGDTPTASWDGVQHNSTSTQQDPQYARPDTDVTSVGTWADQAGATTGLWQAIDETVPASADYVQAAAPASGDLYECSLTDVIDPALSSGHVVRYRHYKSPDAAGKQIDATVELRQGATVIASWAHTNLGALGADTDRPTAQELTAAQADAITSYPDLRLRFLPVSVGGGQARDYRVDFAELEVPYAPPGLYVAIGQAVETDTAGSITGAKTGTIGQAGEADTAQPVAAGKSLPLGQAAQVDTAGQVTPAKTGSIAAATETDTAESISPVKTVPIGQATEADAAQTVTPSKARPIGTAAETDTAQPITTGRQVAIGQAVETDVGSTVVGSKTGSIGQAIEADTAGAVVASKALPLGQAVELDVANTISGSTTGAQTVPIGQAVEADTALAITPAKTRAIGTATEIDTASSITATKVVILGQATELDTATQLAASKARAIDQALELDTAGSMHTVPPSAWPPSAGAPNPRRLASAGAPRTRGASAGAPVTTHGSTAGGPT